MTKNKVIAPSIKMLMNEKPLSNVIIKSKNTLAIQPDNGISATSSLTEFKTNEKFSWCQFRFCTLSLTASSIVDPYSM